jgi:hypothetical protein
MPQSKKDEGWVSLKVAHEQTGASVSAMRNWYRDGTIDSKDVNTRYGPQKLVRLDQVQAKVDTFRTEPVATSVGLPTLGDALRMLADAAERIADLEAENAAMSKVIAVMAGSDYAADELVQAQK